MRLTSSLRAAVALAGLAVLVPTVASAGGTGYSTDCPPAQSLVAGTEWQTTTVATGVSLREGTREDADGYVRMHVLRLRLTTKGLAVHALAGHLAVRSPLSALARGRSHLVAATNSGYFSFSANAPTGAVVDNGSAMTATAATQRVVGVNTLGIAQAAGLALKATVTVGTSRHALAALDVITPPTGVTLYDGRWGAGVSLPAGAASRTVAAGVVASGVGTTATVPSGGLLLVARGNAARTWLAGLRRGQRVTHRATVASPTARPFRTAFAVGAQIVAAGVARTGMSCRSDYELPARTAIGFTGTGTTLILAEVEEEPWRDVHGLDNDQMARLMKDLGAAQAYELDGSGSTEMLAHVPLASNPVCQRTNVSGLSCRTFPADGRERSMPVGIGIYVS